MSDDLFEPPTGDTIYIWQEETWQESESEHLWGTITAYISWIGTGHPLMTRSEEIAVVPFREVAVAHGKQLGRPVRLAKFTLTEVPEVVRPGEGSGEAADD